MKHGIWLEKEHGKIELLELYLYENVSYGCNREIFFFFVYVKFLVCNDSKLRIQWPKKKNNIQFCVFYFFGLWGVYKVEGKKKSLQIRLFFYNGEKNNVWSENNRRSTNVQEKSERSQFSKWRNGKSMRDTFLLVFFD